jgi:hypothetical protein
VAAGKVAAKAASGPYFRRSMMRVVIVTCGILVGASLWSAAFTPARATVPFHGGMSVAASALSDTIVVKKKGVPDWWGRRHCPPGHWKKGWC